MTITYASKSKFLEPCLIEIKNNFKNLSNGEEIKISLISGGYNAEIIVNIEDGKSTFDTFWNNPDPTRFPARIKAAATA
jgi:hypothetical protein